MRCAGFFGVLVGVACLMHGSRCAAGTEPARLERQGVGVERAAASERSEFIFCWDLFT